VTLTGGVKHYFGCGENTTKKFLQVLFLGNSSCLTLPVFDHLTVVAANRYHLPAEVRLQFGHLRHENSPFGHRVWPFFFGPHE
jgi:hypothetical protein